MAVLPGESINMLRGSCFDYTARDKCRWDSSFILGVRNEIKKETKPQNYKRLSKLEAKWCPHLNELRGDAFQLWEVCTCGVLIPTSVSVVVINTMSKAKWGGKGWFHLNAHDTVITSKNSSQEPRGRNWSRGHWGTLFTGLHSLSWT